jgi:predicted DNA-binding mobile mystery protein A
MKERKLIVDQLDRKIREFEDLNDLIIPPEGWIFSIRKAINMSRRQLSSRMNITPQGLKQTEEREKSGTVSLNVLRHVARSLDMKFVYGFIPKQLSLQKMIEQRAEELASEIVKRTSLTMNLENQKPSDVRLKQAVKEKKEELSAKIPKYLWD